MGLFYSLWSVAHVHVHALVPSNHHIAWSYGNAVPNTGKDHSLVLLEQFGCGGMAVVVDTLAGWTRV